MTYDARVASALTARKNYRMPLTQSGNRQCPLAAIPAESLFPGVHAAPAAKAGLLLYLGCWDEAHQVAQDLSTSEGNFWHAIVHRQEPDAWNANYWFQRVGKHAVFGSIQADSLDILERYESAGIRLPASWDPGAFVDLCEKARENPDSPLEKAAIELQHSEWLRLFEWCAGPK
jgi:hypothetical protein